MEPAGPPSPPRPLRVAAHNGAPVWGGAEVAVARLVAALAGRGHQAILYCNDPEVARRAADTGAPVERVHLGGDIALHHALRFASVLRRRAPDVLLVGTFRKLWLAALAARLAGVPRVVVRIGLETDLPRSAKYRFVFRRWVDAVAFNADGMRVAFLAALPGFAGRAVTIHTGVRPPESGGGAALRAARGIPADAMVVGSVGRLAEQKRYDRLVRAVAALPQSGPRPHLLLVGDGTERAALVRLAEAEGVGDRLHLTGHQDRVGPALDAMDVFVISSDREGMSNAMLEAMAAGVPVLSTDVSGAREALRPTAGAGPGRVVADGGEALGRALAEMLADRSALDAMGAAARVVARERFGEERMVREWESLLRGDG